MEGGPRDWAHDTPDHAWYIASWLKVVKNDTRAIFTAAAHGQRAADFRRALQPPVVASACVPVAP